MTSRSGSVERQWVKDLQPGSEVEETYAVCSKEVRSKRGGGRFLSMSLGDRTGRVAALAWENVERISDLCEVGRVVSVRGQVQRYNQNLQVVVLRVDPVDAESVDDGLFVRASSLDPELLWSQLQGCIEEISDPHLKQLLFRVFSDPELGADFKRAPAARSLHHAFKSGLLEHTVSMAKVARLLARHYGCDQDMTVAGALLHDLGKIWELELGSTIEYTDEGRLIGHLSMTALFLDRKISELGTFPAETRRQLLHIVLSHHGELAYGSPRRPKTPEALLVHMVDNLDSKLAGMLQAIEEGGQGDAAWTPFSKILERFVYRRRPSG